MWGQSFMTLQEQRMVLMILRKLTPQNAIMEAVHKLGGFQRVLIRFFEHYELWSPFTLVRAVFRLVAFQSRGPGDSLAFGPSWKLATDTRTPVAPRWQDTPSPPLSCFPPS